MTLIQKRLTSSSFLEWTLGIGGWKIRMTENLGERGEKVAVRLYLQFFFDFVSMWKKHRKTEI